MKENSRSANSKNPIYQRFRARDRVYLVKSFFRNLQKSIDELENEIVISRINKGVIAKGLGMPYSTFCRKRKNKDFSPEELIAIFKILHAKKIYDVGEETPFDYSQYKKTHRKGFTIQEMFRICLVLAEYGEVDFLKRG